VDGVLIIFCENRVKWLENGQLGDFRQKSGKKPFEPEGTAHFKSLLLL
jgi:hypothetical protein